MKYISLLIVVVMISCTVSPPPALMPEKLSVTGLDFSSYTQKDFLFTIDKYLGEYESIGLIEVDYRPEAVYVKRAGPENSVYTTVAQNRIELSKAMDKIYEVCTEMGADALTQFEMEYYRQRYPSTFYEVDGIKMSGFAIKRK